MSSLGPSAVALASPPPSPPSAAAARNARLRAAANKVKALERIRNLEREAERARAHEPISTSADSTQSTEPAIHKDKAEGTESEGLAPTPHPPELAKTATPLEAPKPDDGNATPLASADAPVAAEASTAPKTPKSGEDPGPKFVPLPTILVFPNMYFFGFSIMITGLVETSVAALAAEGVTGDTWVAIVILVLVVGFLILSIAMLVDLYRNHRADIFQFHDPVDDHEKVSDPLLKLWAKFKKKVLHCDGESTPHVDRQRASLEPPEDHTQEPERTERILAHPFVLFKPVGADAVAANGYFTSRGSGEKLSYLCYDWIALSVQLLIVLLAGSSAAFDSGSPESRTLTSLTFTCQFVLAIWLYIGMPGLDRLECQVTSLQFCFEGLSTVMLLAEEGTLSFRFGLFAIFLPILLMIYDLIIVKVIERCSTKKQQRLSLADFATIFVGIGVTMWSAALAVMGQQKRSMDMLRETIVVASEQEEFEAVIDQVDELSVKVGVLSSLDDVDDEGNDSSTN